MTKEEKLLKVFNTIYTKHYNKGYKTNKHDDIQKFFKLARSKGIAIGDEFILKYTMFQYNYYYSLDEISGTIRLSWLLSSKALTRFFERDSEYDFAIGYTMLKKLNLTKAKLLLAIASKRQVTAESIRNLCPVEELHRRNNPFKEKSVRKLAFCKSRTTLFHPQSSICPTCDMAEMCKKEQDPLTRNYRK